MNWQVTSVPNHEEQKLERLLKNRWEPFAVTTRDHELSERIWLRRQTP